MKIKAMTFPAAMQIGPQCSTNFSIERQWSKMEQKVVGEVLYLTDPASKRSYRIPLSLGVAEFETETDEKTRGKK